MIDHIERFFPEAIRWVQKLPLVIRILVFIIFLAILALIGYLLKIYPAIISFLLLEIRIPIYSIILIIAGIVLFLGTVALIRNSIKGRALLKQFYKEWSEFADFLGFLHVLIESYLLEKSPRIDSDAAKKVFARIKEYRNRRAKLRQLIFQVGESNLMVQKIPGWENLKQHNPNFKKRDYNTPFSYLLDIVNPIAAINLHGKTVREVYYISFEFMEYLEYKYPFLKKVRIAKEKRETKD